MDYKGLESLKTKKKKSNKVHKIQCIFKHIKINLIPSITGFIRIIRYCILDDFFFFFYYILFFLKLVNKMENGTTHTTCLFLQLLLRRMKTGIDTPNYSNSPEYINAMNTSYTFEQVNIL